MDAIKTAGRFGIREERALNYECDSVGTDLNYKMLSNTISAVRKAESRDVMCDEMEKCFEPVKEDYKRRHKR